MQSETIKRTIVKLFKWTSSIFFITLFGGLTLFISVRLPDFEKWFGFWRFAVGVMAFGSMAIFAVLILILVLVQRKEKNRAK